MRACLIVVVTLACVVPSIAQTTSKKDKNIFGDKDKAIKKDKDKYKEDDKSDSATKHIPAEKVAGRTRDYWESELKSPDASKRSIALMALVNFGDESAKSVPAILGVLNDSDVSPRGKACMALRIIAIDEGHIQRVIKALAARLSPKNESEAAVRYEAIQSLRRYVDEIKDTDKTTLDILINGMRDPASWEIRHLCIATLWRAALTDSKDKNNTDGPNEKIVEALVSRLTARTSAVYQERLELVIGLGSVGKPKSPELRIRVIKALEMVVTAQVSTNSGRALKLWGYAGLVNQSADEAAIKIHMAKLAGFLQGGDKGYDLEIRLQAVAAMGALGERSKKYVPNLITLLSKDEPINLIHAAATSLVQIAKDDPKLVDVMLSLLKDSDHNKAMVGVIGLVNLKANKKEVLTALDDMLADKKLNINLRSTIEQGLKILKEPAKDKK